MISFKVSKQISRIDQQEFMQWDSCFSDQNDPVRMKPFLKSFHPSAFMGFTGSIFQPGHLPVLLNYKIYLIIPVAPGIPGDLFSQGMVYQMGANCRFNRPLPLGGLLYEVGKGFMMLGSNQCCVKNLELGT